MPPSGPVSTPVSNSTAERAVIPRIRATLTAIPTAALALGLFVVAWLYRFNDPGGSFAFLTDDHFFYLVRGWQILFSELPVRDFVDHGAPLFYYVGAGVQMAFGRGTLSEITFCVTVLAACAAGVFLLATRASGSRLLGLAAAIGHVLLEPRFYNYPKILVYVLAIPALWAFANRPDRRRLVGVAVITVVAFLFRHDHGAFVAAAFAVLLLLLPALPWRQRIRQAVIYGLVTAALAAPYLLYIQFNGGLGTYFRAAAAWAERDRDRAEVVWPGVFDNPDGISDEARSGNRLTRTVETIRDNRVAWIFYAELALPLVALLLLALSPQGFRPAWAHARAKLGAVAVLGMMLNIGFLRSPLAARLADPSVPHAILIAWLPVAVGALLRRRDLVARSLQRRLLMRGLGAAAVVITVPLLAIFAIAVTDDWRLRLGKAYLANSPGEAFERAEIMADEIAASFPLPAAKPDDPVTVLTLAYYVRQCTQPTDRVFMQHYLPQVAALAERGFAGGHADLRPGFFTSTEMQQLTVQRLRRQSVPIVLVGAGDSLGGFRDSFPIIAAYFDEYYRSAGEREFDGRFDIRALVRKDARPTGSFAPLGWPCFR